MGLMKSQDLRTLKTNDVSIASVAFSYHMPSVQGHPKTCAPFVWLLYWGGAVPFIVSAIRLQLKESDRSYSDKI